MTAGYQGDDGMVTAGNALHLAITFVIPRLGLGMTV